VNLKTKMTAERGSLTEVHPSVSAIIPTKNRAADLQVTVRSLLHQTFLPDQLIIVDQSDSNASQTEVTKVFRDASASGRGRIQLLFLNDPSIPGGAVARNKAMDLATGNIWLFLDDDVILEPTFLEELVRAYGRRPEAAGISGIVTNYAFPSRAFRLWSWLFARGPFHDERQWIYWNAERLRNEEPIRVSKLGGGLMSFRAEVIRGMRFDDNLVGVSDGEDVDFCTRLGPKAVLFVAPRARLLHRQSPSGRELDHQLRREARAKHYLYYRNWNHGFRNKLYFIWLNVGYGLAATAACLRRISLAPWRALVAGMREGKRAFRTPRHG
jgi:GT2 family glycosyltransferase